MINMKKPIIYGNYFHINLHIDINFDYYHN